MRTIEQHAQALADGSTTSRALVEQCLDRIADPNGEGSRAFIKVHAEQARAMADAMDMLRRAGREPSRYAGIPVSLKDLFDIAGEATPAGSRVLADAPPATAHAPVVQRMLAAGFVPRGPHQHDRVRLLRPRHQSALRHAALALGSRGRRIPGGSSSGTAVSVADGMAVAGLGTDTGGSCRIPAAFCGIVGYKPTARRVPITGVLPLAPSLDSVGPLAPSVACCAVIDAVLAGEAPGAAGTRDLNGLRLAVPTNVVLDGMDATVASAFDRALAHAVARRRAHRAHPFAEFDEVPAVNAKGGFAASEAYAWHRTLLAEKGAGYDPRIRMRIERGERMTAADYLDLVAARQRLIAELRRKHARIRCAGHAHRADRAAAHRRARRRTRVQPDQPAHPAQHRARQLLRPLLDQPALPSHGRAAGWADAGRRDARRCQAVCHCRGDRGGAVTPVLSIGRQPIAAFGETRQDAILVRQDRLVRRYRPGQREFRIVPDARRARPADPRAR